MNLHSKQVLPTTGAEAVTAVPQVVLQPRYPCIGEWIEQCAAGKLAFDGPDSLCSRVAAMGFKTTSLYEMVRAAEQERAALAEPTTDQKEQS